MFCIRRQAGLAHDEFLAYWRGRHADLVRRHAETLRIKEYTQVSPVHLEVSLSIQQARGFLPPFDGVATICFESLEDFLLPQCDDSARMAQEEIDADCALFIDPHESSIFLAQLDLVSLAHQ